MLFYILNIEQENDTTISLYGIQLDISSLKSTKIIVQGLIATRLIHTKDTEQLEKYINEISQKSKIKISFDTYTFCICTADTYTVNNYFYKKLPKKLDVYKIEKLKTNWNKLNATTLLNVNMFTSPVEQFIIEKKIKGPCVVKLNDVQEHGNGDLIVSDYKTVEFVKHSDVPPHLVFIANFEIENKQVVSFCVKIIETKTESYKCYLGTVNARHRKEIETIKNCNKKIFATVDEMRNFMNEIIRSHKPSILLHYNMHDTYFKGLDLSGVLVCDVFLFAQNVTKGRDYTLEELCKNLKIEYIKYPCEIDNIFHTNDYIYKIYQALDIFELSKQIGEICGCLMQKVFSNNRAERIEYLLMHELYERNCILPDKVRKASEHTYTGGLVLTPEIGFYETLILLLDFNSLYPSIIQEFNICFSTVGMHEIEEVAKIQKIEEGDATFEALESKLVTEETGILPKVLNNLINRRKAIKNTLGHAKNQKEQKTLDTRQKAIKLTANSIYGCLGCTFSRFSNYTMAGYITYKGRQILKATKFIAENDLKMKVIYGDTDSIMIDTKLKGVNSNFELAVQQSEELKKKVNSQYKAVEIEVEKVIKKLCLYTKKKYGCLSINKMGNGLKEYKGLDFVRRDFASVATEISKEIFDIMITDFEAEHKKLSGINEIKHGLNGITNNNNQNITDLIIKKLVNYRSNIQKQPLSKFIMSTQLKRDPESYNCADNLLHVSLALRLNKTGSNYKKDDFISYYIGEKKNATISQRTYHPSELANIDYKYYIENQILPSLHRILSIYDGISATDISTIFGVQKQYKEIEHKKVTIASPCCNTLQEPTKTCLKCNTAISDNFYQMKMLGLVKSEIKKLYHTEKRCTECGLTSDNYFTHCFHCEKEMVETIKNKEFNDFILRLISSFKDFPNIKQYLEDLTKQSEYMVIDFKKYFMVEIKNSITDKKN